MLLARNMQIIEGENDSQLNDELITLKTQNQQLPVQREERKVRWKRLNVIILIGCTAESCIGERSGFLVFYFFSAEMLI